MNAESRYKHKQKGLCIYCPQPSVPGHSRCIYHLNYSMERSKYWRKVHKDRGQCPMCGNKLHPEMDDNHISCINCRESLHM